MFVNTTHWIPTNLEYDKQKLCNTIRTVNSTESKHYRSHQTHYIAGAVLDNNMRCCHFALCNVSACSFRDVFDPFLCALHYPKQKTPHRRFSGKRFRKNKKYAASQRSCHITAQRFCKFVSQRVAPKMGCNSVSSAITTFTVKRTMRRFWPLGDSRLCVG